MDVGMVPVQARRLVRRNLYVVLEGWVAGLDQRVEDVILVADRWD
jgi:hypothetical protein